MTFASALDPTMTATLAEGILPWVNQKGTEAQETMRTVAVVIAIGFVIFIAFKSRGALSAVIVSGLVSGLFLWFVFNVTTMRDRVGDEVNTNSMPVAVVHADHVTDTAPHMDRRSDGRSS